MNNELGAKGYKGYALVAEYIEDLPPISKLPVCRASLDFGCVSDLGEPK